MGVHAYTDAYNAGWRDRDALDQLSGIDPGPGAEGWHGDWQKLNDEDVQPKTELTDAQRTLWIYRQLDLDTPEEPPDEICAAALRIGKHYGWYHDPVMSSAGAVEMARVVLDKAEDTKG